MAYTNSSLVDYTFISPYKSSRNGHAIDTISIHCVVGQCGVEALGSVFQTKQASSNYGIGYDGRVGMYVEEKERSWCTSNADNDRRAVTIECASDTTSPYAVNSKVYAKLIDLLTDICKRNGIKKLVWSTNKNDRVNHLNGCNMTVHRDYNSGKSCPGDYLYNRHGQIAAEVNKRLGEEEMTQAEFDKMFDTHMAALATNNSSSWSEAARKWAIDTGVCGGDGKGNYSWPAYVTREQMAQFLYNLNTKIIEKLPTSDGVDKEAIAKDVIKTIAETLQEV